jgi:hypothetical protein
MRAEKVREAFHFEEGLEFPDTGNVLFERGQIIKVATPEGVVIDMLPIHDLLAQQVARPSPPLRKQATLNTS